MPNPVNSQNLFEELFPEDETNPGEVPIPQKCVGCMIVNICNPISHFISLHRIGIKLAIESCAYHRPAPKAPDDQSGQG